VDACTASGCYYLTTAKEALDAHVRYNHPVTAAEAAKTLQEKGLLVPFYFAQLSPTERQTGKTLTNEAQRIIREADPNDKDDTVAYSNVNTGSDQKPMVTREEYERARAVLDALPPGYYVKCAGCGGWFMGGEFKVYPNARGPHCERCVP